MDTESFKLLLSVLSATVAVVSAIVAYRTRRQTRQDMFENHRDMLLLAMSENDIRLRTLDFKVSLLHKRLTAAEARLTTPNQSTQALIEGLAELSKVARSLQRRDWTDSQVRASEYSESALREMRQRTLHEQVTAKTLQSDAHSVLLEEAQVELDRLTSAA